MELIFASLSALVIMLSVIAILGIGSYEVLEGTLSVGSMVAFYTYALQLFGPLYGAVDIYARLQRVGASARRLLREMSEHRSHFSIAPMQSTLHARAQRILN